MHRLHHPHAARWILLLGLAIGLCSLPAGLVIDDHVLRMHLSGRWLFPEAHPILSLFSFIPDDPAHRQQMIDLGVLQWWTHPELHISFLRPLSSLTHWVDHTLWPDTAWLAHLHNVLWWGLTILTVGGLLREIHGPRAVAALGLLLFVLEDAHAWPIWWISNRNALVALCLGALAAWGHVRWRRGGGGAALAWSLLALAGALLAGESGIATLAWLLAWQLTMEPGPLLRRALALLPAGLVIIAWKLGYGALGFGAHGSGLYIDPAADPLRFLGELGERAPLLALGQWTQTPVDVVALAPPAVIRGMQIAGILTLGALALWLRPLLKTRAEARFHALAFLFALLPACATFTMARLLTFAGVSAAALLAMQAEQVGLLSSQGRAAWRTSLVTSGMLVLHGPVAGLMLVAQIILVPGALRWFTDQGVAQVTREAPTELLVIVNGDSLITSYMLLQPGQESPPERLALLAPAGAAVEVSRPDAATLEVTVEAGWLWARKDQLMRDAREPFVVGETIQLPDYQAEIRAVLPDGQPETVRFTFARPLADPGTHVVAFDGQGFVPFNLPVGASRTLPGMVR